MCGLASTARRAGSGMSSSEQIWGENLRRPATMMNKGLEYIEARVVI